MRASGLAPEQAIFDLALTLTAADHAAIADALSTLESKLSGLISLNTDERRSLNKMGEKSETFYRRTLVAMSDNAGLIPADVDVAEAQRDLAQLDLLCPHIGLAAWVQKLAFRSKRLARLNLARCAGAHANQGKHEFIRVILTRSFNPG